MRSTRIFTLAWEFPPMTSGESVVSFRTLKYSKFTFDVCCGQTYGQKPIKLPENICTYSLKGKYILWPLRVATLFKKLDKEYNYKVVFSRVMPINGHIAGLIVKLLKPKIKWIVYFSDPVWNSPFIRFSALLKPTRDQRPNYFLMKIGGIFSWLAVCFGDRIIFNNERLARYVLGRNYEKKKDRIVITPYGHEGVKQVNKRVKHTEIVIAHIGQIYGDRNLKVLISALEWLKDYNYELYTKLKILLVGYVCEKEKKRIYLSQTKECFVLVGQVSYEKSLEYMEMADYLLIIDPHFHKKGQNIYVPVKIFDYMSVGKPIIGIADNDSMTAEILEQIGGLRVSHDTKDVYELLIRILSGKPITPDLKKYEKFHCIDGVKKLDNLIDELIVTTKNYNER